jgi:serine/threonine-protein kinase
MTDTFSLLRSALADRYRLERELGRGGMATVYLAHDLKHDRNVTVKVMRPELAAAIGAERFLSEIKTTANLQHPHILPLHDSGEARDAGDPMGRPYLYYVMPYVEGESLRDLLTRKQQLPIADAVRIATEVASALDYAHRHGVIHRDIKPENILLHDGNAVVADFGIALAVDVAGGQRLTETGMAVGTPPYMSPEQSVGERELDGRSDIYALGCVLYEMLAGEPPYTGPTAQAIFAKRMTHPVPSVRSLRETVPESVDRALASALAKSPADRLATAHDFAEALVSGTRPVDLGPMVVRPAQRSRALPLLRWVAALVVLAVAGVGIVRWRRSATPALDANLIAIAPFDVVDPALGVWREGAVDLLSRTLDGAGSLRTVSPSVVLHGWRGRSDRASATALAHRAGAGLAATSSLSRRGGDSVEVRSALLDIGRANVIGEVSVVGTTVRMGELVDSLGLEILRTLSRDRPVAAVRQATIGSAPLPALKAFLRGEQFYRRSLYDSALVAYSEAIAHDSGFALAWNPPTEGLYGAATDYTAHADTLNHGLSGRDSLLIAADSATQAADSHLGCYRDAMARLDTAARRFPGDPEVWYALGEARYHFPHGFGEDYVQSLAAFDRAIALDPGFGPAYEHILDLALRTGQSDRAFRYARAATSLEGTDENSSSVRLASRLLLVTAGEGKAGIARLLDSAKQVPLFRAGVEVFPWWPDSNETAVQALRRLAGLPSFEGVTDSVMGVQYVAWALAFRGHLREAYQTNRRLIQDPTASRWSPFLDPFLGLALLGAVPDDIAAKAFSPSLQEGVAVRWDFMHPRYFGGLPWWAMKKDTASLTLFGRRMGEAAGRAERPEDRMRARYLQVASVGYLALAQGDSATALSRLSALPDTVCALVNCFYQKIAEAALLAARGEDRHAAEILDVWLAQSEAKTPIGVLARLDRARIAERLHERETRIRFYQFVVDAWRHADPELQPYVAEAKEGLARLAGEPR